MGPPIEVKPIDPQEVLPLVSVQLNELAALPPGPAAQSKVGDILALIVQLLTNPAVAGILPVGWKMWTAAAVAALTLIGSSFTAGRFTAPTVPVEVKPAPIVAPEVKPDVTPIIPPVPIVEPKAQLNKVVIYRTELLSRLDLAKLPAKVFVDPKVYAEGSSYPWGGKSVPLPCMALIDNGGKVIDVAPFVNAEGAGVFLKGK